MQEGDAAGSAEQMASRILAHLATERDQELSLTYEKP